MNEIEIAAGTDDEKTLLVHEPLEKLAMEDPVRAEVVKLHYFVGLTHAESAGILGGLRENRSTSLELCPGVDVSIHTVIRPTQLSTFQQPAAPAFGLVSGNPEVRAPPLSDLKGIPLDQNALIPGFQIFSRCDRFDTQKALSMVEACFRS